MDEDEDDYVFHGTPIEREEETSARKRKAVADAGQLRALPLWKQEVRDEEGRRRLHGAFTGGFSAGYYNTVGSKEGWTPQTFTSSRKNRAEVKQQSIYNFLDENDIKDMGGHALETSLQFDTFGFTAAEFARKQAEKEQQKRPSAIPGPVPDEIVLPAANSIGIKLLQKMGWRHGHSIKETLTDSLYARREARKAFLAFSGNEGGLEPAQMESHMSDSEEYTEKCKDGTYASQNTRMYVLHPKQDLYGLGYDPFKHAPEFKERKTFHQLKNKDCRGKSDVSMKGNLLASNSGRYAPGFGIGALEDLDIEDEDIYASGFDYEQTEVEEVEPSRIIRHNKHKLEDKKQGVLRGFKVASVSDYKVERFHPPVIPADFEPHHKFQTPLEMEDKLAELPPPEVPPPEDNILRLSIEGLATLVARYGKHFEDLSKEKHRSNPLFSFLNGGNGQSYYARKLWEEKRKKVDQQRMEDVKSKSSVQTMTAEGRGRILGERPLERSSNGSGSSIAFKEVIHFQSNLSDTFTKPISVVESSESTKPFKNDPAKQERFELFLKDKYQGGLRSTQSLGSSIMSEADRARERLDFEAAAEAIQKGEWKMQTSAPSIQTDLPALGEQFFIPSTGVEKYQISQDEEKMNKFYPKREEFQWRPSPILCKRFDIIDPFMGKPPPLPRPRSKMETLVFMTESLKSSKIEETNSANRDSKHISQTEVQEIEKQPTANEPDTEPSTASVQRPVDLYKAIFSDESDDDGDDASLSQVADPVKKNEGANTALNRLIAGDFLESLGKELGLEVPLDKPCPPYKANSSTLTDSVPIRDLKIPLTNETSTSTYDMPKVLLENKDAASKPRSPENGKNNASSFKTCEIEVSPINGEGHGHGTSTKSSLNISSRSGVASGSSFDVKEGTVQAEKDKNDAKISRSHSKYQRSRSSSPCTHSTDQHRAKKSRTHSRHHRSRSKTPDTDSSSHQHQARKNRTHLRHHRSRSRTPETDYSGDQNRAKRSRTHSWHHHRSTTPDTDSSSDCWYRDRSRSSLEKSSPRGRRKKHSRHHKNKRRRSSDRYASQENDRDLTDDSQKDRKSGNGGRHAAHLKSDSHKKYR